MVNGNLGTKTPFVYGEGYNAPSTHNTMIRFVHTNIITNDWQKLAEFYTNVFGCKLVPPERDLKGNWLDQATGIDNAHLNGCHLALPGYNDPAPTLEIFQYDTTLDNPESQPNRKGLGHIAFSVDNVQDILTKVLAHGGTQVGEIVSTEIKNAGELTFVYARDIDGNIIELQNWRRVMAP